MDEDLVATLLEAKHLPTMALRRAVADPEAIAEPVLEVLVQASDDPDVLTEEDANLLFWGLHALAANRDTRVFRPLLQMLRQDAEALEALLGDAIGETLGKVLASTFDGDADALHRLVLDSTIDDYVRSAAFEALGFLTREGRLDRDATRGLLERFDDARVSVEEDLGWSSWEEAIAYLGFTELVPRVEAARRDGRITDEISDFAWFRRAIRQVTSDPPDYSAFRTRQSGYLDDPVTALGWTDEKFGKPTKNPFKNIGRNDPCPCGSGKKYKKCCLNAGLGDPDSDDHGPITSPLPGLH